MKPNEIFAGRTYLDHAGEPMRVREILRPAGPYDRTVKVLWNRKPRGRIEAHSIDMFARVLAAKEAPRG